MENKKSILLFEEYGKSTKENSFDLREEGKKDLEMIDETIHRINTIIEPIRNQLLDDVNGYYTWNMHTAIVIIKEQIEEITENMEKIEKALRIKK